MGRHAGLSRLVENFRLDKIRAALQERAVQAASGMPAGRLT